MRKHCRLIYPQLNIFGVISAYRNNKIFIPSKVSKVIFEKITERDCLDLVFAEVGNFNDVAKVGIMTYETKRLN